MGGLTDASTITIGGTKEGAVIGTAAYMSPEQARGQTVDKRTDIWAFGCVLYEMLTGRQAFPGPTISDAIASILEREPDWTALPPTTPLAVGKLLRRCLAKDLRQRLADARDARLEIEDALSAAEPASTLPALAAAQRGQFTGRSRRAIAVAAGAVLLIAGVLTGIFVSRTPRLVAPRMTRTTIVTSATDPMKGVGITRAIAISADGRRLAYRSVGAIVVRPLDELASTTLAGVGLANHPFFSPDGQWIGFVDDDGVTNPLKKVAIAGGPAVTLAQTGGGLRGACWNADGTIVFATGDPATGLLSVSAAGGKPEVLTVPDQAAGELDHIWPEALPGSAGVLFTIQSAKGGIDQSQVAVLDLRTRNQRVLVHGGSDAQYVPPGHLVYAASGPTLRAVRFDLARLEVVGAPVPVLEDVATTLAFAAEASVAADGTLIYRPAQAMSQITLVWVDRQGREEPLGAPPRAYNALALSPDGTRLAVGAFDQEQDVWLWNVGRQSPLTRLTVDPAGDAMPVWTPDGRRLIWMSLRAGPPNLYTQAADGTGTPERLTNSPNYQRPSSVTPDGKQLVLWEDQPDRGTDLMLLNLEGTHTVTPLLATPFRESRGMVSPDGKWLVYESNESGKYESTCGPSPTLTLGSGRSRVTVGSSRFGRRTATSSSTLGQTGQSGPRTGTSRVGVSPQVHRGSSGEACSSLAEPSSFTTWPRTVHGS